MSNQSDKSARKPYSEPTLVEYGALAELTQGTPNSQLDLESQCNGNPSKKAC